MRKVGVAAIKKKQEENKKFSEVGKSMESIKLSFVQETMTNFKESLTNFAVKHRNEINSDPEFRLKFHMMCKSVGVDPLSSSKGFWAEILGIGDFYFELGVIVVQICIQTRSQNGGLIPLSDMLHRVRSASGSSETRKNTSEEDIKRAVEKLSVLGSGFRLVELRGTTMIQSVPLEMNRDHEEIMSVSLESGCAVSVDGLVARLGWARERIAICLTSLVRQELAWIDDDGSGRRFYYFPSLWHTNRGRGEITAGGGAGGGSGKGGGMI